MYNTLFIIGVEFLEQHDGISSSHLTDGGIGYPCLRSEYEISAIRSCFAIYSYANTKQLILKFTTGRQGRLIQIETHYSCLHT